MTSRREFYARTEATWPAEVPALTAEEAVRAGRKLYRFVRGRTLQVDCVATSGRRYSGFGIRRTGAFGDPARRVLLVNPERGWKALVHELSHTLGGGHSKDHARLEARMIREVLKRGWLDGVLRSDPKPEPTAADRDARRLALIEAGLVRWDRRLRRAQTAIRKLQRRRAYYLRKAGGALSVPTATIPAGTRPPGSRCLAPGA